MVVNLFRNAVNDVRKKVNITNKNTGQPLQRQNIKPLVKIRKRHWFGVLLGQ